MDELVKRYTGFQSWDEMKHEMEEHNFVPLVVNEDFANTLRSLGYHYWDGVVDRTKE